MQSTISKLTYSQPATCFPRVHAHSFPPLCQERLSPNGLHMKHDVQSSLLNADPARLSLFMVLVQAPHQVLAKALSSPSIYVPSPHVLSRGSERSTGRQPNFFFNVFSPWPCHAQHRICDDPSPNPPFKGIKLAGSLEFKITMQALQAVTSGPIPCPSRLTGAAWTVLDQSPSPSRLWGPAPGNSAWA